MMIFWMILGGLAVAILFYVVWLRNWMRRQTYFAGFFLWIEPFEIGLYRKSETLLFSRFLILAGILPPILDQFKVFNIPELMAVLPGNILPYVSLSFALVGIITEMLRRATNTPLAIVSLPTSVAPEVRASVEQAVIAQQAAIILVNESLSGSLPPTAPPVPLNLDLLKAEVAAGKSFVSPP